MDMTISCSWEEFKRMAREFRENAPTLEEDQLENAWKCLALAYGGMREDMWRGSAAIVLEMESRTYLDCVLALDGR